ncbi:unnamed protein product [marine sediment metagenome]|uniref:Uncharacterized protein n=1 Tax=marine sediment metagenome TaxID=412755 RepID=X1DNC5_9ZZZZ
MNTSTFVLPQYCIEKALDLLSKGSFFSSTNVAEYFINSDEEQLLKYIQILGGYCEGAREALVEGLKMGHGIEED